MADQLQHLVKDSYPNPPPPLILSELHLTAASKANLPGFYLPVASGDPEDAWLEVFYMFEGRLHRVVVSDSEPLHLPMKAHHLG